MENRELTKFENRIEAAVNRAMDAPMDDRITVAETIGTLLTAAIELVIHQRGKEEDESF